MPWKKILCRRESIEIHGIPESVSDDNLEETCLNVLEEIGVGKIKPYRVHACHRLKNRKKTIIRFVSRKNADSALHHRKNLKDLDMKKFGGFRGDEKLFINESLCPPMQFLHYLVRTAHKNKNIHAFNLWKGRLTVQVAEDGLKVPIRHIDDLIALEIATEDCRDKFIV